MAAIWRKLTHHDGNGWWDLPKSVASGEEPSFEGPISGRWIANFWRIATHGGVSHAGPGFYWLVGLFLAIVTLLEVWLFSVEGLGGWYVPILLGLSAMKFIGVVAFFMHLRFDNRLFTYIFGASMIIGIGIFSLILLLAEFAHQSP